MKIVGAALTPIRLRLRRPLSTAHGMLTVRKGWLLALSARDDTGRELCGWGEASPIAGFGMEGLAESGASLRELARSLLGRDARELDDLIDTCEALAPDAPGACGAVDSALHDLNARARNRSIASWLRSRADDSQPPRDEIEASMLLEPGPSSDEATASRLALMASLERARRDGYRTFKLKLGQHGIDRELACTRAVALALEPGERLRLDANGAWRTREAHAALTRLADLAPLPIEFIEQPVPARDLEALACLRQAALVPIAADEAAASPAAARAVIERSAADFIVLKPSAAGGLRASMRVANAVRRTGTALVITSLLDSAIGVAAALQVAAALPGALPACGLATGALFEEDVARAFAASGGRIRMPATPGLGLQPEPHRIARLMRGDVETFLS